MSQLARNPFRTSQVRPGAIGFRFSDPHEADALVERLRANRWWGQIVGPHGSGKSTLLHTLLPRLQAAGRQVHQVTLRPGQRRLPADGPAPAEWHAQTQLVVDGYEQLGAYRRWRLRRTCRARGAGLLVTAHRSAGLPELTATSTSVELAVRLAGELAAAEGMTIDEEQVRRSFQSRGGNLREVFFDLYDLCEAPATRTPTAG